MKKKNKFWIYPLLMMGLLLVIVSSCKKKNDETTLNAVPVLTTADVSAITQITAVSGGTIMTDGGTITARGVCWSTGASPTISNNKTVNGSGTGSFTSNITGLTPATTYHLRAYATNITGTGYGDEKIFTTNSSIVFNPDLTYGTATDQDGNVFKTIIIGTQTWMAENLKVTHYRNGVAIPKVTGTTTWDALTTGAYSCANDDDANVLTYGRLYNWYAVTDTRNIAPTGWHMPTTTEWNTLISYLGGSYCGFKLMEAGTTHWVYGGNPGNNASGFTALPGAGYYYYSLGMQGYWWSATGYTATQAFGFPLEYTGGSVSAVYYEMYRGFSVRCIKD